MVPPFGHIFPRGTPKWIHGRWECSVDIGSKNVTDTFQIVSASLSYLLGIQNDSTYLDFMGSYLYFMFSLLFETVKNQECSRIADADEAILFIQDCFLYHFPHSVACYGGSPRTGLGANYSALYAQPCSSPKQG